MKLLLGELCLCCALVLTFSFPWKNIAHNDTHGHSFQPEPRIRDLPDRCDGLGFDAATFDDQGVAYFFRGAFVWKGFQGPARPIDSVWPGLPRHLDAAFRMHHPPNPALHHRLFFFKGDHVWQYYNFAAEGNFLIRDKFPGVPDNLDGVIECSSGDCAQDFVLFFKGDSVFVLDLSTNVVKQKAWPALGGCSALLRWIDRYYCFSGTNFTRFNPSTGEVPPRYPKDSRDYFMRCEGRGHWSENSTVNRDVFNRCSNLSFDEFDQDEMGRMYAFRGNWYFRLDAKKEGWHPWSLNSSWPSLQGKVHGAFSWDKKMYFIQESQLFIYKAEARYSLIEGYPKPVSAELGVSGSDVDATFICPHTSQLYVIMGNHMRVINLEQTPRVLGDGVRIGHSHVDGAMCTSQGVYVFVGTQYYRYSSPAELSAWETVPAPGSIKQDFMSCSHRG